MTAKKIAKEIIKAFEASKKLLIAGNGGSAAEAQHLSSELVGRFEHERTALPAIALTTDTSILTSWSNDHDFSDVFRRQVEALGEPGDVFLTLTTSGKSKNILIAEDYARDKGLKVLRMPNKGKTTAEIQENHLISLHQICRTVEKAFI